MRRKLRRVAAVAAIISAGGILMQTSNFACESFAGESLFTAIDMCFIFDCQNGAFGGLLNPCDTQVIPRTDRDSAQQNDILSGGPLLGDCFGQGGP